MCIWSKWSRWGRVVRCAAMFGVALMAAQASWGDGFFAKSFTAKALPTIPSQRALLAYRDGTERLVIESSLWGEGEEFGWIIPVPAKPTAFEKTSPGLIKTLSLVLQPRIIKAHRAKGMRAYAMALAVVLACWALVTLLWRARAWYWPVITLLLALCAWVLLFFSMPLYRHASIYGRGTDLIHGPLEETARVGSYDLAVLNASDAQELDTWLTGNGFSALPPEGTAIVDDYIASGWRFVAAKLHREGGDGATRPHPLAITFPIDKPVYPMRLTALPGSDVYLELFVIADGAATQDQLTLELADQFAPFEGFFIGEGYSGTDYLEEKPKGYQGSTYHLAQIGHPDALTTLWDGCTVSKLAGTLTPAQMASDLAVDLGSARPHRATYYAKDAAGHAASATALLVWSAAVVAGILLIHLALRKGSRVRFCTVALLAIVLPTTVAAVVVQKRVHASLLQVNVQPSPPIDHMNLSDSAKLVSKCYDRFEGMSPRQIRQVVADHFTYGRYRNPFTREWVAIEDSPGNIQVFEDERGVVLRMFGLFGNPSDVVVKSSQPTSEEEKQRRREHGNRETAALGLAKLGDPRGVDVLVDLLGPDPFNSETYDEGAAKALVDLANAGKVPDFGWYIESLRDDALVGSEDPRALQVLLKRWETNPEYGQRMNGLADMSVPRELLIPLLCRCAQDPARYGAVVLRHLKSMDHFEAMLKEGLAEAEVAMLAVATRTPSPSYLPDAGEMGRFLDTVEQRLAAASPGD